MITGGEEADEELRVPLRRQRQMCMRDGGRPAPGPDTWPGCNCFFSKNYRLKRR